MFRTPIIAALTVALLSGTAMAQAADAPPADLSNSARNAPDYDEDAPPPPANDRARDDRVREDRDREDRDLAEAPPPAAPPPAAYDNCQRNPGAQSQAQADRDIFCRRDAAARTGYITPGEAARDEQARGTIGGTLGGAVLGTILGAAGGNAGLGAAAGAGAGLLAGSAIGSDNARHAANSVEAAYADAYYGCMHQDQRASYYDYDAPPPPAYGYAPPPPVYYYPGPAYYPYPYYAPSLSFGFGFGGGHHWGGRGFGGRGFGGHGFRGGGWRHR